MAVCYRHPDRETGVSCSSCGRPICPDCMTPTPVGMRCPECARDRTKVRTARNFRPGGGAGEPSATLMLVVINVLVFFAVSSTGGSLGGGSGGSLFLRGALFGPSIAIDHDYWRLLTSGFLHQGFAHILFNMIFLYVMGPMLEAAIGRTMFFVVYFTALLAGSFGALILQPHAITVGASGAAFGVLGALLVVARKRGISIWESGLGFTLAINVVFSLTFRTISIGGHLGGLIGGALAGLAVIELAERRNQPAAAYAACALIAVAAVAGAIAVAGGTGLLPNGVGVGFGG